ncbi:MAG: AsmA family protein, partial [Deltaproteobacteria bacterium]|nr:AsmA family protein [Deltaproteobacteria bacterium]
MRSHRPGASGRAAADRTAARRGDGAARGRRLPAPDEPPPARPGGIRELRRVLVAAAALAALVVILSGVALYLLDAEKLREPLQAQVSAALGRETTVGGISLALFPLPALRASEIRIAGPKPADRPFAEIAELRLRVAILPLLAGKVVLRALEVESPRVRVPLDRSGRPILPGPATESAPAAAKPGAPAG